MGLDIHVMRPKRFFMRDFVSPVQQLLPGVEIHVIGAHPLSALDAEIAEQVLVKVVRTHQLDQETNRYFLPASDEVVYSERFSYDAFDLLREFAAFQDFPPNQYLFWGARSFGDGYDIDQLPSIKAAWRKQRSSYPHLVFHEDNSGFYFPTTLTLPVKSDFGYLGSTSQLRQELAQLSSRVHTALRHRETVNEAIEVLQRAIECAEQSHLPVIFDG